MSTIAEEPSHLADVTANTSRASRRSERSMRSERESFAPKSPMRSPRRSIQPEPLPQLEPEPVPQPEDTFAQVTFTYWLPRNKGLTQIRHLVPVCSTVHS